MSVVADLRQALQDVVAPDLKAGVAGLSALRDEVRDSNALLREELVAAEKRSSERLEKAESRLSERLERVYDAVKIADLTRRNAELEEQLRRAQATNESQQH